MSFTTMPGDGECSWGSSTTTIPSSLSRTNKEKKMNLATKYAIQGRNADAQLLIDKGVIDIGGELTDEGRNLLAQIVYADYADKVLAFVKSQVEKEAK
jgi:hypothetical protein